jgi:hypothetical protein
MGFSAHPQLAAMRLIATLGTDRGKMWRDHSRSGFVAHFVAPIDVDTLQADIELCFAAKR